MHNSLIWSSNGNLDHQEAAGLRFGDKGTHTSRTMMLAELTELLAVVPGDAPRGEYRRAVVEDNILGKETSSNQRLTNQRLSELYGLDPSIPIFRVLRRLWDVDPTGRPLIAFLCALARDPLLRGTAPAILGMYPGQELTRSSMTEAIEASTEGRLNPSIADKVARNAGSSWTQSGHLEGRVRKVRRKVTSTPGSTAFALWLGEVQGRGGEDLLRSAWSRVLDAGASELLDLTLRAKQMGLVHARAGGGVIEIDSGPLDPTTRRG